MNCLASEINFRNHTSAQAAIWAVILITNQITTGYYNFPFRIHKYNGICMIFVRT